jgi:putative PIN family toxin of toxin-antitoxin system
VRRIVADTNIIISALLRDGLPRQIMNLGETSQIRLLTSEALIAELSDVLSRKKFKRYFDESDTTPQQALLIYRRMAEQVEPGEVPEDVVRDKKDRAVLACAVGGKADYLVTGDEDLLILKTYQDVGIVTPAQLLGILQPPSTNPPSE